MCIPPVVCQHSGPIQAIPADALAAVKASALAPKAVLRSAFLNDIVCFVLDQRCRTIMKHTTEFKSGHLLFSMARAGLAARLILVKRRFTGPRNARRRGELRPSLCIKSRVINWSRSMRKILLATATVALLTAPLVVAAQADDVTVKERGDKAIIKDQPAPRDTDKVIVKEREPARSDEKVIIKDK